MAIAQFLLQGQLLVNPGVHLGGVELHIVAAGFLGLVHGGVGVHQQRLGIGAVIGEGRNAHAARHIEGASINGTGSAMAVRILSRVAEIVVGTSPAGRQAG